MADRRHLEILERGVYDWNQWRKENARAVPDLREAYLREADLVGFDLRDADMQGAMLLGADLSNADLRRANLSDADFRFVETNGARLGGARFERTRGVSAGVLRRAQRPMRLQRRVAASLVPTLITVVTVIALFFLLRNLTFVGAAPTGAADGAEQVEAALEADPGQDLTALLESLDFSEWSVKDAELAGSILVLTLDVEEVDETVYLPTLTAACGALRGRPDAVSEIRILERTGQSGWAYDRPDNCAAILQAPTHMLRLAAGADSLRWRAGGAAR